MITHQRRIRKLHLAGPNEALVRRGAMLVEDAFHTASLPSLGNRLLIVRSLPLGPIRTNQSSAAVALAIEERLRLLASTAVYAQDASAPWRPIVYFNDETEPYILLALRVARGLSADEWFWPLAVPCFCRGMPADEVLRAVLYASGADARPAAAIAIVGALTEHGGADRLFEALGLQDGPALLRAIDCRHPGGFSASGGISSSVSSGISFFEAAMPARSRAVLERWSRRWGTSDARSLWLAASLMIAQKPARRLDPDLPHRAQQLIALVTSRSVAPAPRARDSNPLGIVTDDAQAPETEVGEPALKRQAPTEQAPSDQASTHQASTHRALAHQASSHDVSDSTADEYRLTSSPPAMTAVSAPRAQVEASRSGYEEPANAPREPIHETMQSPAAVLDFQNAPLFSSHAGMFFLLPVMSRLGMAALLNKSPHLIEIDLPARVLLRCGARLDAARDDPIMSALAAMCSAGEPALSGFVQPDLWKEGICNEGPLLISKVRASPGERVLFDGSGRLALARWRHSPPDAVHRLAVDCTIKRGATIDAQAALDLLLDSWLTAMRRWCRRHARVGIRDLACRPGRVSVTRTHVDVFFDHRQADIRVRKAGLDLNPGWILWFGRVVSFHYE